ncbi:MAG: restriction endonuclease [Pseudomonadota bacterium]
MRPENLIFAVIAFIVVSWLNGWYVVHVVLAMIVIGIGIAKLSGQAQIEQHYREIDMAEIDLMDGLEFERYVGRLLKHEGYSDVKVTQGSGDNGVDIFATRGTHRFSIQVKRQQSSVSRRAVSDAVAGRDGYECDGAMVVTNNWLSPKARKFAEQTACEIVERETLIEWVARYRDREERGAAICAAAVSRTTPTDDTSFGYDENFGQLNSPALPAKLRGHTADDDSAISATSGEVSPEDRLYPPEVVRQDSLRKITTPHVDRSYVPRETVEQMKNVVRLQFPHDYTMQAFLLKKQTDAFLDLQSLRPNEMTAEEYSAIIAGAESKTPGDYVLQLWEAKKQIAAFCHLRHL